MPCAKRNCYAWEDDLNRCACHSRPRNDRYEFAARLFKYLLVRCRTPGKIRLRPVRQDQFDITQAQAGLVIQPDGMTDYFGREAMPVVGGGGPRSVSLRRASWSEATLFRRVSRRWREYVVWQRRSGTAVSIIRYGRTHTLAHDAGARVRASRPALRTPEGRFPPLTPLTLAPALGWDTVSHSRVRRRAVSPLLCTPGDIYNLH
jgi:hypothetical protein